MKTLIKAILALLVLVFSLRAQGPLGLNVAMDKNSYLVGEPLQVAISVLNNSPTTVHENFGGSVRLLLENANGEELKYVGPSVDYFSPNTDQLEPLEENYNVIELNRYFGKIFSTTWIDHYLDVGRYTLKVFFNPPNLEAQSTEVSFQVINPEGGELAVYDAFIKIARGDAKGTYTKGEVAEALRSLHVSYPNSVYAPIVLTMLDAVYDISLAEHAKALAVRRELVEKYPQSVRGWGMIEGLLKRLPSNSERIEYLKKLHTASKNSLMEKIIERKLKTESSKVAR